MPKKTLLNLLQLLLLTAVVTLSYRYYGGAAAAKAAPFALLMLVLFFDETRSGIGQRLKVTLAVGLPILALYFLATPDLLYGFIAFLGGFFLLGALGGLYEAYIHQRGSGSQMAIMTQFMPVMLLGGGLLLWLGLHWLRLNGG